jgi:hypothetical protein
MQARARFIVLGLKLQLGLAPTVQLFSTSSACSLPSVAQLLAFEMECDGDDLMGMLGDDCSASVPPDENNCSASANKSTSDEQNSSVGAAPALFPPPPPPPPLDLEGADKVQCRCCRMWYPKKDPLQR